MKTNRHVAAMTVRFLEIYPCLKQIDAVQTLSAFAESIGLQRAHYYKILHGARMLTVNQISALIEIYKISPNWLFLGEGNMFQDKN